MNTAHESYSAEPAMWLTTAATDEAPCPIETEEVRRRFSWRTLLTAPWHCVETLLWGVAATDEKYLQEVPLVIEEIKQARSRGLVVAR